MREVKKDIIRFKIKDLTSNLFDYQAREPSPFPAGFLTAQFLQKKRIYEAFVMMGELMWCLSVLIA